MSCGKKGLRARRSVRIAAGDKLQSSHNNELASVIGLKANAGNIIFTLLFRMIPEFLWTRRSLRKNCRAEA